MAVILTEYDQIYSPPSKPLSLEEKDYKQLKSSQRARDQAVDRHILHELELDLLWNYGFVPLLSVIQHESNSTLSLFQFVR